MIKLLANNYMYLQLIPVVMGLIVIPRLEVIYRYFVLLLFYSFINDLFAGYYADYISVKGVNMILFNIFNFVLFSFLFWLFYKKSNNKSSKTTIIGLVILYILSINYELIIGKVDYHTKTQVIPYIIGGVGVIICVFQYFIAILNSEKTIHIYNNMLFWIAIAHFMYYVVFIPFKYGENFFSNPEILKGYLNFKIGATVIKGILLSIGFIWTTRRKAV